MMRQSAEDEADWQQKQAQLYAPPKGHAPRRSGNTAARSGTGMSIDQVKALMGQVAAEDAQYAARG